MPDYSKGKIYKLCNTVDNEIYIGSTTQKLNGRFWNHKSDAKNRPRNTRVYKHFNNIGCNNVYIELIENFPCESKRELEWRERYWKEELNSSLNTFSPRVSDEEKKEYNKEYYEKNKYKIEEQAKQKITCECGCTSRKDSIQRHRRSKKHFKNLFSLVLQELI